MCTKCEGFMSPGRGEKETVPPTVPARGELELEGCANTTVVLLCAEPWVALRPEDCPSKPDAGAGRFRPSPFPFPFPLPPFPFGTPSPNFVPGPVSMGQDGLGAGMDLPLSMHSGCGAMMICQEDLSASAAMLVTTRSSSVTTPGLLCAAYPAQLRTSQHHWLRCLGFELTAHDARQLPGGMTTSAFLDVSAPAASHRQSPLVFAPRHTAMPHLPTMRKHPLDMEREW